jgi:hypothetical protein
MPAVLPPSRVAKRTATTEMLRRHGRELRAIATFGIAIFGPIALVSFLATAVTSIGGVPGIVGTVAVISIPATVLALTLYLAVDLAERYPEQRDGTRADHDEGSEAP